MEPYSDTSNKGYKNNTINFVKKSFLMQNVTQINTLNQNNCKNFKRYHSVSLKSLIGNHFNRYDICWVEYLEVMVPNTVVSVPKF